MYISCVGALRFIFSRRFQCHSVYIHEVGILCDADQRQFLKCLSRDKYYIYMHILKNVPAVSLDYFAVVSVICFIISMNQHLI